MIHARLLTLLFLSVGLANGEYNNSTTVASASHSTSSSLSSTSISDSGLGALILHGLAADTESTTASSTHALSSSSSLSHDPKSKLASDSRNITTTSKTSSAATIRPSTLALNTVNSKTKENSDPDACVASWTSYEKASLSYVNYTVTQTYTATAYTAKIVTLCDKVPRVKGPLTPTSTYVTTGLQTLQRNYTGAAPTCSVPESACKLLESSYNPMKAAFNPNLIPDCKTAGACGACNIYAKDVVLMYFAPPSNHTYKLCETNSLPEKTNCPFGPTTGLYLGVGNCQYDTDYSHSVATTGPSTILPNGQVLYSSNVYLSFKTAYAEDQCSSRVGKGYAGAVVTLASTDLYSANGPNLDGIIPYSVTGGYSFNFDDLQSVPGQIYMGASCQNGPSSWGYGPVNGIKHTSWWCDTIYQSAYFPTLLVPPQIRSLDPAWASCQLDLCGSLDPPIALTAETLMAKPTSSNPQDPKKSDEAAPASSASPDVAKSTATSVDPEPVTRTSIKSSVKETATFTSSIPGKPISASQDPNVISIVISVKSSGPRWQALPPEAISLIATGGGEILPKSKTTSAAKDSNTVQASQNPDLPVQAGASGDPAPAVSIADPTGIELGGDTPAVSVTLASTGISQADPIPEAASNPAGKSQDPEIPGASPPEGSTALGSAGDITAVNNPKTPSTAMIGSSIAPPSAATVVSNIPISIGSGFVVANSRTWTLPKTGTVGDTPVATIASQPVYADPADSGMLYIGSSKIPLAAGSATTIDKTPVSMDQGRVVAGSATITIPTANNQVTATVEGSEVLVTPESNGGVVIGGATFSAGDIVTIAGSQNVPIGNGDPKAIATVGTVELTPDPANTGAVVIGGNTLSAGDITTIAGTPISVGPAGVLAGSQTIPIGNGVQKAIATIGTVELTPDSINTGAVVINGNTLSAGDSTTIAGTAVSLGSGYAVVGSKTISLPIANTDVIATVGNMEVTTDPSDPEVVMIGGAPIPVGVVTTIAGTPVSVGSGYAIIGSKTASLPSSASNVAAMVGDTEITTDPSGPGVYMIGGTPISAGAITTIDGTPVSIGSGYAIVGSKTISLSSTGTDVVATIGEMEITTDPSDPNAVIIGGTTVSKGVVTTISGTPVSVGSGIIVAGSRTISLPNVTPGPLAILSSLKFSTDPSNSNAILVGSTTLSQGDVATISGTVVSVGSGVFAIGSQTFAMPSFTSAPNLDAVFTDDGNAYTASNIDGKIYLGSLTLSEGGPAATLPGGEVVTAGTDGLVVGAITVAFTSTTGTGKVPQNTSASVSNDLGVPSASSMSITSDAAEPIISSGNGSTQSTTKSAAAPLRSLSIESLLFCICLGALLML